MTRLESGPRLEWHLGGNKRALATASRRNALAKRGPAANSLLAQRARAEGRANRLISQRCAALLLVLLAGGSNVVRDLLLHIVP